MIDAVWVLAQEVRMDSVIDKPLYKLPGDHTYMSLDILIGVPNEEEEKMRRWPLRKEVGNGGI